MTETQTLAILLALAAAVGLLIPVSTKRLRARRRRISQEGERLFWEQECARESPSISGSIFFWGFALLVIICLR